MMMAGTTAGNTIGTTAIRRSQWRRFGLPVIGILFVTLASGAAIADAVVERISGLVEISEGDSNPWVAAENGDAITPGGRVRTGADGRVEVGLDSGVVRLYENSMLQIPAVAGEINQVDLERGYSIFDVLHRPERRFEVQSPTVVVSVKGTLFGVDVRGEVGEVAVYRGLVGVRAAGVDDAMETLVREGFVATGNAEMPFELDLLMPDFDPWTEWEDARQEAQSVQETPTAGNAANAASGLDRAKASLLRATDSAVLEAAAERKPRVMERLRELGKQTPEPRDLGENAFEVAPPAAMILDTENLSKLPAAESVIEFVVEPVLTPVLGEIREIQEPQIFKTIDSTLGSVLDGNLRQTSGN
jgi:hypothetical protein